MANQPNQGGQQDQANRQADQALQPEQKQDINRDQQDRNRIGQAGQQEELDWEI